MRKTLKKKLTGSMLLAVAAALVIVSLCLLLGTVRYSAVQFSHEVADVFTTDVLTELNSSATGSAESAALAVEQTVDANAGLLRIGAGRSYTVWDAETGEAVGGALDNAAVTDNVIAAMDGAVGDSMPLLAARMDIAIPISGEVSLVLDIVDDGSAMRALLWNALLLLCTASVLSLIACAALSQMMAGAFAASAVQTARALRAEHSARAEAWEAMALTLYRPGKPDKNRPENGALDVIAPYLSEGYLTFGAADGGIIAINRAAEQLLGVTMDEENGLAFAQAFPGVPMPDETQSMVHGRFTSGGRRLDVVFAALGDGTFAAIVRPVDGEMVR